MQVNVKEVNCEVGSERMSVTCWLATARICVFSLSKPGSGGRTGQVQVEQTRFCSV